MKRPRLPRRSKPTPDTDELMRLATAMSQSSCRVEDDFWERRLTRLIEKLLAERDETSIISALDQLYTGTNRAYDGLIDLVESATETHRTDSSDEMECVLLAAPVLAWSRYQIAAGPIPAEHFVTLRVHLQAHVLAANARLAMVDFLFSPDQLPQSYVETAQLKEKLAHAVVHGRDLKLDPAQLPETVSFLSDSRYVIAAVAAPKGMPMFRWQEEDCQRDAAFAQWREQGGEALRPLLPACAIEILPPSAYHSAVRDTDRASRPYSIQAAMAFLQTVLNRPAEDFRAVIAAYYDRQLEEYRIGFTYRESSDVLHGLVWPLLDSEDENAEALSQIENVLRESGLHEILTLDHRMPLEYCDDCGAPLFPNPDGEPTHAELPEERIEAAPRHLH